MTWDDLDPRGKFTFMLCFMRTVPALVIVLEGVCVKSKVLSFQAQNPSQPTNIWLRLWVRPSDSWCSPGWGGTLYHRIFLPFLTYLFHSVNLNRFSARSGTEVPRLSSHTWV